MRSVRVGTVRNPDVRAEWVEVTNQPTAGLFGQLTTDAVVNRLMRFAGSARQEPHVGALVTAQDDALADEADHVDALHQLVGWQLRAELDVDLGPLPAVRRVEQRIPLRFAGHVPIIHWPAQPGGPKHDHSRA